MHGVRMSLVALGLWIPATSSWAAVQSTDPSHTQRGTDSAPVSAASVVPVSQEPLPGSGPPASMVRVPQVLVPLAHAHAPVTTPPSVVVAPQQNAPTPSTSPIPPTVEASPRSSHTTSREPGLSPAPSPSPSLSSMAPVPRTGPAPIAPYGGPIPFPVPGAQAQPFDPGPGGPVVPMPYAPAAFPPGYGTQAPATMAPMGTFQRLGTLHNVISVVRYDDPKVANVSCFLTGPKIDPNAPAPSSSTGDAAIPVVAISCQVTGSLIIPAGLPAEETLPLPDSASFVFDRCYDPASHTLLYTVISKAAVQGLHSSAIAAISAGAASGFR